MPDDEIREVDRPTLVAEMEQMLRQNTEAGERLSYLNALPPQAAVLAMRINLLLESAFGPLDYDHLDDESLTTTERLVYEHAFQRRLRVLYTQTQRQHEAQQGGLVAPAKGLILP